MNVVPIDATQPEPGSPLDFALRYAALGWHVFPVWGATDGKCNCKRLCKSPGKHPVEHLVPRGQDDATTDPATIRRWWAIMQNAGVAIFLRPSGLCAIDIDPRNGGFETMDDIEAQHGKLVSDVTQYTQSGGEHRIFKIASDIQMPGKLGPGIDVKRNGYIVLAPTRGVSGAYLWEASSDPLEGAIPSPLPDWLRSLAHVQTAGTVASVASRYATDAQLGELRDALSTIASDDRDLWVKFGLALAPLGQRGFDMWDEWSRKSKKYDPVDAIRVWRGLKPGQFNFESIFYIAQQNGWINPLAGAQEQISPVVIEQERPAPVEKKKAVFQGPSEFPVSVLNSIMRWMEGMSEEPTRQITMQGVLSLASVLAGRIYESENGNVSSMYYLTLASTGTGKGYPKDAIRRLLTDASLHALLSGSGNTSAGAVFSALFKAPTHIQISDEFGKHLQAARKQTNGAMSDAFAVMTEAYSDTTGILVPRNYSNFNLSKTDLAKLDSKIVHRPAITLFAFATPEQVFDNLTTLDIDDGFLNRFVAVEVTSDPMPEQRMTGKETPKEFIDWARALRRKDIPSLIGMDCDYDVSPTPISVAISPEAWAAFDAFKREIKTTEWLEPRLTMRWRENSMRLSTLLAVADNPQNPVISEKFSAWSIDYIRENGMQFMRSACSKIADSDFHRLYLSVADYIERAGKRGMTEGELSERCKLFRRSNVVMRDQVLLALLREDRIFKATFKPPSGRGQSRNTFVDAKVSEVAQ